MVDKMKFFKSLKDREDEAKEKMRKENTHKLSIG
jgi:hypothetical protein